MGTCENCEKRSYDVVFENGKVFERFRCRETGLVHERGHQCDVLAKPRLCDALGVNIGEMFKVRDGVCQSPDAGIVILQGGALIAKGLDAAGVLQAIITAINHPEKIERVTRLTPEEVQRCRAFGAKWVSRDVDGYQVWLWETEPELQSNGVWTGKTSCAQVWDRFFPSVRPGQLVKVEDEPSEGAEGK